MPSHTSTADTSELLSAALERALLVELLAEWRNVNESYFRSALRPPSFTLGDASSRLGLWFAPTRTIEISRSLVLTQSWRVVVEILKHEMAHQFVDEQLGVSDETAHGASFQRVCHQLGIDAAAAGLGSFAGDVSKPDLPAQKLIRRVADLLALAASSNLHEAEAAMAAAQKLMLKYNIDLTAARSQIRFGTRHLGPPTSRKSESDRWVATILGQHFFVDTLWVPVYLPMLGKRASVLEICGSEGAIEIAEYVHDFLHKTAEHLWVQHRRDANVSGNRDRRVYLAGVMAGFYEKLNESTKAHKEAGLVWVANPEQASYFKRRHPYTRTIKRQGVRRSNAFAHGKAAGRNIVLHRGVRGATESRGLALPRGSK